MVTANVRQRSVKLITALAAILLSLPLPAFAQAKADGKPANLVPAGYRVSEEIKGDLNKDGLDDYVFIVKGPKRDDDCREDGQDCSLRGIMIALNKGGRYELALENRDCFASEDRDGGVYYPPELSVSVKKGNLYIEFNQGRYGKWSYTFRYQNSDFEMIGYDANQIRGPYVEKEVSVNFLSKKMLTKRNTVEPCEGDCEEKKPVFEETWENFTLKESIKLQKINFDGFSIMDYVKTGK
jgi:hypothetical protein